MKRTRDTTGNEDGLEVVSKKQIIEEEHTEDEEVAQVSTKKIPAKKQQAAAVNEERRPSRESKTPRKLPSTTPRKKAERTIYAPSIDSSSRDETVDSPQVAADPRPAEGEVVSEQKKTAEKKHASRTSDKKPEIKSPKKKEEKKLLLPPAEIDVLNLIDVSLLGASWFIFGMLAVWFVLSNVQPVLANTLETRVLAFFDLIADSYGHYFAVEMSYFIFSLLAFHFALTLIMTLVDEQN
jgi:hypothetical protein